MKEPLVIDGYCQEKESVEFESKECRDSLPKSFWETYSSFANTFGGIIVLGFKEEMGRLKLTGVSDPDAVVKTIWDTLHNRSKVSANILTEDDVKVEQADGLSYITVKVPRADRHIRPVYLNNDLDNGTYRRNSEGDYHCTIPEILEMGRDSSEVSDDSRAIENTGIEDINRDSLNAYRNYLLSNNPSHPWLRKPEEEFLRLIGAADIDKDRFRLTQAGLLMFGKEYRISRELPNYHLDYRYYLDSDEWNDRLDSGSGMWSGNVFDFYLEVSRRLSLNSNVPFALKEDRRVYDTVLMKAEREMVLNGLVHADYHGVGGIVVRKDEDSLCVRNPGLFRIPPQKAIRGGYIDARNPLMMKMFMLIGLVERSGSGIYRIIKGCQEMGLSEPLIKEDLDPSAVTFQMFLSRKNLTLGDSISLLIRSDGRISVSELSKRLGVSRSTIQRELDSMKADGVVKRVGGTRGYWSLEGTNKDQNE